ncbi:MAG: C1 family peptidase, partial [Bacteroidaceae bacterium]
MTKKCMFTFVLGLLSFSVVAQEKDSTKVEGFEFTTVKECPITSIKNQNRSSTCWSFSSVGFIESELLRKGKGTFDLSEMFVVHHTMIDRAANYVRLHGESSFSPGGSFNDAFYCLANYGIVPQEAMNGIQYGDTLPVHNELDVVAEAYVKAIAGSELKKLTPVWKQGLIGIYDTYLGVCPQQFFYKGKNYTPQTFAKELAIDV